MIIFELSEVITSCVNLFKYGNYLSEFLEKYEVQMFTNTNLGKIFNQLNISLTKIFNELNMSTKTLYELEVSIKNINNLSQGSQRETDLIKNNSINIYSDCYLQDTTVNRNR
jgi:hypothetical protein